MEVKKRKRERREREREREYLVEWERSVPLETEEKHKDYKQRPVNLNPSCHDHLLRENEDDACGLWLVYRHLSLSLSLLFSLSLSLSLFHYQSV